MMKIKSNLIQNIYILSLALTLSLHIFNLGGEEGLKPFHVAAAVALVLSVFIIPLKGDLFKKLTLFLSFAFLSSLFSYSNTALPGWLKIFVVIFSCYGLAFVDTNKLFRWLIVFIPIDLGVLSFMAITDPQYRFQGFYNDPNYLCVTLIAFLFVSCVIYMKTNNKIVRIVQIVDVVIILGLVLYTLSRAGFVCTLIIIFMVGYRAIRKSLIKTAIVLALLIPVVIHYASPFLDEQLFNLYERSYGEKTNLDSSSNERIELSFQNINFIIHNPQYVLLGLGVGTTSGDGAQQVPGLLNYRVSSYRDHNSWTSCFSEHGAIAFIFFFQMFLMTGKGILKRKKSSFKSLALGVFISILMFSFTIYQTNFLPFWWTFFLINNNSIYDNENFTYSTNRASR